MGCTITTNFTETPAEQAKAIGASKQQILELGRFICHCKAVSFADTVRLIITAGKRGSLEVMAIYKRNGETTDICMIEWARNGELLDVCFT